MSSFVGKVSGFHVSRFGAGTDARLRCFAVVSDAPPPKGKEIQVFTEELPLQLALSVGTTLRTDVEVAYDEGNDGNRLNSVRMLDR